MIDPLFELARWLFDNDVGRPIFDKWETVPQYNRDHYLKKAQEVFDLIRKEKSDESVDS